MTDFQTARANMVDSQIHPMGVVSEPILEAFSSVRREEFVPDAFKNIAYLDEDLPVGHGRSLMDPTTHARLIQALTPTKADKALDVGCLTGYSTVILAKLCSSVLGVEPNADFLSKAQENWARMGFGNIIPHNGPFMGDDSNKNDLYDVIFVNGAVNAIPNSFIEKLAVNGRLAIVVRSKTDRIGRAILVTKDKNNLVGQRVLFDCSIPYLPSFEPKNEFVF